MTKNLDLKKQIITAYNDINVTEYPSACKIVLYLQAKGITTTEPTVLSYLKVANVKKKFCKPSPAQIDLKSVKRAVATLRKSNVLPTVAHIRKIVGGGTSLQLSTLRQQLVDEAVRQYTFSEAVEALVNLKIYKANMPFNPKSLLAEVNSINLIFESRKTYRHATLDVIHHAILMALEFKQACALVVPEHEIRVMMPTILKVLNLSQAQIEALDENLSIYCIEDSYNLEGLLYGQRHMIGFFDQLYTNGYKHILTSFFISTCERMPTHSLTPDNFMQTLIRKLSKHTVKKGRTFTSSEWSYLLGQNTSETFDALSRRIGVLWHNHT